MSVLCSVLNHRGASSGARFGISVSDTDSAGPASCLYCSASAFAATNRSSAPAPVRISTFEYGSLGLVFIAIVGPVAPGKASPGGRSEAFSAITIALPCGIVPKLTGNRTG